MKRVKLKRQNFNILKLKKKIRVTIITWNNVYAIDNSFYVSFLKKIYVYISYEINNSPIKKF